MSEIDMTAWLKKNPAAFAAIKDKMVVDQPNTEKAKQKGTLPAGYMGREPPVDTDLESRKGKGKAHDLESTFTGRAIPSENAKKYFGRGSGKAAPFDSEGGMSPGQSPSLYNPIKEKKGGSIKKKHGGSTTKMSTAKPSSKSSCW